MNSKTLSTNYYKELGVDTALNMIMQLATLLQENEHIEQTGLNEIVHLIYTLSSDVRDALLSEQS